VASDLNRLATAQAKLGQRASSIANHSKAVGMTEELRSANPKNVELAVAVGLAHLGRGDAHASFGRSSRGSSAREDLASAERDYLVGIEVFEALLQQKAIEGTDVQTLAAAREELKKIRADLARAR
jgi:hypothetical protein